MATITVTDMTGPGVATITWTTATASDTFTYQSGRRQIMLIDNISGGAITPNIDGDGATSKAVAGIGGSLDTSGGFDFASIANGAVVAVDLDEIKEYLKGTIAMTGADDARIAILQY